MINIKSLYRDNDSKREVINKEDYRSPFRRDYARILHSPSFRRLDAKLQLFPGFESDFFRNRLTHSLEVAQISKSIAQKLNNNKDHPYQINEDICECAGLAHDIGHPPFGHTGERALDRKMSNIGGFESNAQTLRLLTKIEKKYKNTTHPSGINTNLEDKRKGLNLTYRVLASILKYDNEIPTEFIERYYNDDNNDRCPILRGYCLGDNGKVTDKDGNVMGTLQLEKGYYSEESRIVRKIKDHVVSGNSDGYFRTIECDVMDIADDIAYSTYDLEDAFKAEFLEPNNLVFVSETTLKKIKDKMDGRIDEDEIRRYLVETFVTVLFEPLIGKDVLSNSDDIFKEKIGEMTFKEVYSHFKKVFDSSYDIVYNGYERIQVTSQLVDYFVKAVEVDWNESNPVLSTIDMDPFVRDHIDVLKHFTYTKLIESPMMKVAESRGYEIVSFLFEYLVDRPELLPKDYKRLFDRVDDDIKHRIICDFISGMTDRYAIEFYGRLTSDSPESIFKPI